MRLKISLLILAASLFLSSCIHTSRISNVYNYGAQLKPSDVVLFTGFNYEHSDMSKQMQADTKNLLGNAAS